MSGDRFTWGYASYQHAEQISPKLNCIFLKAELAVSRFAEKASDGKQGLSGAVKKVAIIRDTASANGDKNGTG